jgi:uncharacterized phage protein (TIGR02218 family)
VTRSIGAALQTHLESGTTTLAMCWKISRTDGVVLGFTSNDVDIDYGGVTYQGAFSGTITNIRQTSDMAVDNLDVEMILDSSAISEADLAAGLYDFADIEIFLINYEDTSQGIVKGIKGKLGKTDTRDVTARVELRSMAQFLQQVVGEICTPTCRADLGDSACGVDLGTYTVSGTITGVDDRENFYDSARTEANDYFNYGLLTWASGSANEGLSMEVKDYVLSTGKFTLVQAMPYDILVGDGYDVSAGCDLLPDTCKDKFSNYDNFQGEPDVPGTDKMLQYPDNF